jgi:carboxyl-terminal processing protease
MYFDIIVMENKVMNKKGYNLIQVIIIIVITSVISAITTGVLFNKGYNKRNIDYSELSKDENVQNFLNVYSEVLNGYYENIDKKEMINSAINGMMNYLNESYTSYLGDDAADNLMNQLKGTYEGIGVTIQNGVILSLIDNSPAQLVGLLPGDKIVMVNDTDVTERPDEISTIIKNNKDNVILVVERDDEKLTFNLNTEELNVPNVESKIINSTKIGYVKAKVFTNNLTDVFKDSLNSLEEQGMESLIIDLRDNTGGYLEQAYNVASLFLKKGKIIYSLKDKDRTVKYKDEDNNSKNYKVIVLVNHSTASAAEILTTALKDSYGATVVGTTTYGKGKVQHTYSLNSGGLVKYTSSLWLRPNGTCIDKVGIVPDYKIENEIIYDDTDPENIIVEQVIDNQLNKAIELLSI